MHDDRGLADPGRPADRGAAAGVGTGVTYAEPIEAQLDIDEAHTDDPLPAEERITGPCEQEDCE